MLGEMGELGSRFPRMSTAQSGPPWRRMYQAPPCLEGPSTWKKVLKARLHAGRYDAVFCSPVTSAGGYVQKALPPPVISAAVGRDLFKGCVRNKLETLVAFSSRRHRRRTPCCITCLIR